MADIDEALRQNREAVEEFLSTAAGSAAHWSTPRAPTKWSPSQVTEHVSRALEQSGYAIAGKPTVFPVFPVFLRPVMRSLFFNRMVKTGRFPKGAKTNGPMDPESGPATPDAGRRRLQHALTTLEQAARACSAPDQRIETTTFGRVSLTDYLVFQAHHTRHHRPQLKVPE